MKKAGFGLVVFLAACGGGGGSTTTDGGQTADGTVATDGGTAADSSTTVDAATTGCGTGVTFSNLNVKIQPRGSGAGAGIVVTASCSGTPLGTTDATGSVGLVHVGGGTPLFFSATGGGHLSGNSAEFNLPTGTTMSGGGPVEFDETFAATLYPDHDTTHAEAWVAISGTQTGACMGRDGWVVALTGHPEAHVRYVGTSGAMLDNTATATTTGGGIYISMITPGPAAAVTATKAGCTMSFTLGGETGKVPLVANAISYLIGAAQ